jgi:hypothetical protein
LEVGGKQHVGSSKIRTRTTPWPSHPTPGYVSKWSQNGRGFRVPTFTAALFKVARIRSQLKCLSAGKWIKKTWSTHTMKVFSARNRRKSCHW